MRHVFQDSPRAPRVVQYPITLGLLGLICVHLQAQTPADDFDARPQITTAAGIVSGTNRNATREPDEPEHDRKPGGHSVWISWLAPETGLATFHISAATFDTTLAVYWLEPGAESDFDGLKRRASDDDSGPNELSWVQFPAEMGQRYEIAVDGYSGDATGEFDLSWELLSSSSPLPVVVEWPADQALQLGDSLVLHVDLQEVDDLEVRWFLNGEEVDGGEESTLRIEDLNVEDLGQYRLRIKVKDVRFFTAPAEIQINSEGLVSVLARDKLLDAASSGLDGQSGALLPAGSADKQEKPDLSPDKGPPVGVVRGYTGTQIFNTTQTLRDPAEPSHCGVEGGASYWLAYHPPEDGRLTLDTTGSNYDTILSVYTYDPPLTGYSSLEEVTCDNGGGADGRTSQVDFDASAQREYFVVVDGAGGMQGIVHLNYQLEPLDLATLKPAITKQPPPMITVSPGTTLTLAPEAVGTPPLSYQWYKGGIALPAGTNLTLMLDPVEPTDSGDYSASVANDFGSVTTLASHVSVTSTPRLQWRQDGSTLVLGLDGEPGRRYTLETRGLTAPVWIPLSSPREVASGPLEWTDPILPAHGQFYRLRVD